MATLSVLKFDSPDGATQALGILERLQKQELIKMVDSAIVKWPTSAKAPITKQSVSTAGIGAASGAFWGFLFGLLFFMPLMGMAIGAAAGALGGSLADYGINDDFIKQSREKITPGTSALFLMTESVTVDKVIPELASLNPELITSNLTAEQEAKLREMFPHHDETTQAAA